MILSYELRIGVTGHRNLREESVSLIEQAVASLLSTIGDTLREAGARPFGLRGSERDLKQRCQLRLAAALRAVKVMQSSPCDVPPERQTPVDWVVVSPLAKGADRIVARAVLALADRSQGPSPPPPLPQGARGEEKAAIAKGASGKKTSAAEYPPPTQPPRLEVILPLPVDEYRKDFAGDDDHREFDELFAPAEQAGAVTTLNADFKERHHADPQEARRQAYESVGRSVVDACEILIAVWDGKPAQGRGGTADIVRYAVDAGRLVLWIDSDNPAADAQVLERPDEKAPHTPTGGGEDFARKPLPTRAKQFSLAYHRLAAYQRDVLHAQVEHRRPEWIAEYETAVAGDEAAGNLFLTIDAGLQPHYVRTDALAKMYQNIYRRAADAVYCCSVAAVAIVAAQVLFFPHHTWLIAFEIAAMCVAMALVMLSDGEQWKSKWQHDRHLAEWLRRLHFTLPLHRELARLKVQIIDPRPYPGAEEWFENAFRPVLGRLRRELTQEPALCTLQKIIDQWIRGQADWHKKQIQKHENDAHHFHLAGWSTFAATLLMAVLHIAGVGHSDANDPHATPGMLGPAITLLAIVLPAVGAALHACAVLRDHDRLAARSKQLEPVLRGLADRTLAARDRTELARIVAEADHVMAEENDDWWLTLGGQAPVMPG